MTTERGLAIEHLDIVFDAHLAAVSDLSLAVAPGEAVALVGESGSGKSLTVRAVLGLLPPGAQVSGRISFDGVSLTGLDERAMSSIRGKAIAMIFQDPLSALNPVMRVGEAIAEVTRSHTGTGRRAARAHAVASMRRVGIRDPEANSSAYPHQLSGGMRQRVMIAMALAAAPRLLLADEPTTALDVVVQANILRLLEELRRQQGMAMVFVSHDLAVVAGLCDRVAVMYAGEIVEEGPADRVLADPRMPYTAALLASARRDHGGTRLRAIDGRPPALGAWPAGCRFAPRCPMAAEACRSGAIPFVTVGRGHRARCIRVADTAGDVAAMVHG
jgi:oligopeptide/dipeptide ABC transporter ATP-binding protein